MASFNTLVSNHCFTSNILRNRILQDIIANSSNSFTKFCSLKKGFFVKFSNISEMNIISQTCHGTIVNHISRHEKMSLEDQSP
jgi:hypothetical protein